MYSAVSDVSLKSDFIRTEMLEEGGKVCTVIIQNKGNDLIMYCNNGTWLLRRAADTRTCS